MREKVTLERAKQVAELLNKKFKHGKSSCPAWFRSTCTPMEQDGSYGVAINTPSWATLPEEVTNFFLEPFEGIRVTFRVVTPSSYNYGKKKNDSKDEEKDDETKKRGSDR